LFISENTKALGRNALNVYLHNIFTDTI